MAAKKFQAAKAKFNFQCKEVNSYESEVQESLENRDVFVFQRLKSDILKIETRLDDAYLELTQCEGYDQELEYLNYRQFKRKLSQLDVQIEHLIAKLSNSNESHLTNETVLNHESRGNIRLPKFDLPAFDGNIHNWLSYKQIFLTTIHENVSISNVQKLQYLEASVTGDAARLIKGFPIIDSNYLQAWETLTNRYDNKRELAYSLCSKIFGIKTIKVMSSKALHDLLDCCNESIRNLNTLGLKLDTLSELMLIHFLQKRLDNHIRTQWELTLEDQELPSYNKFISFLEKQARSMQSVKDSLVKEEKPKSNKSYSYNTVANNVVSKRNLMCALCQGEHSLFMCNRFISMNSKDKWEVVKRNKLCFNCLRVNHDVSRCRITSHCKNCTKRHHTLLHDSQSRLRSSDQPQNSLTPDSSNQTSSSGTLSLSGVNDTDHILLSTAIVRIKDSNGDFHECRALLDNGSQMSLITEECCKKLKLHTKSTNRVIMGTGNHIAERTNALVNLQLTPYFNSETFYANALVVTKLTTNLPNFYVPHRQWSHLKHLQLADPDFNISRPVDLILGADIFFDLILSQKRRGIHNTPSAINSKLGWLLTGKVSSEPHHSQSSESMVSYHTSQDLDTAVKKFWELESLPEAQRFNSQEQTCEDFYNKTLKREESGRYIVKLPFKTDSSLGDSRNQAVRRFLSLEKKLEQNSNLYSQYKDFMAEYQALNHMEVIPQEDIFKLDSKCFYMPHHGVVREQSTTTKLRVVFDASARSTSNVSLNDLLHTGPKLQTDLFGVLLKFRTHLVVLTADIEKMFRQVKVAPEDADFQRIVWRENSTEKLKDYRLLTVTYGTASAPYLAMQTIRQLAKDEESNFPKASAVICKDFYVDDLLTGAESVQEAEQLMMELIALMKRGGFSLRKWLSNESSIIETLPPELKGLSQPIDIDEDQTVKLLGIQWDPVQDTFRIRINQPYPVNSKRELLSNIARIYDPIGFLAPTTILAKIMIQELWMSKVTWDESLPTSILSRWNRFASELLLLKQVQVGRFMMDRKSSVETIEIHGFCDASKRAYAAVLYLRVVLSNQQVKVCIIAAKTRVAPLKLVTLPRLELCAAVLLSELHNKVVESLCIQIDNSFFWTDSQIVLDWIKSEPQRWKTFVANRISLIQGLTQQDKWKHVISQDNPADCASRGIMPSKVINHSQWWQGPSWLSELHLNISSCQECHSQENSEELKILSHTSQVQVDQDTPDFIKKYSSFTKLIRIMAWCIRFIHNCKCLVAERKVNQLKSSELDVATMRIVKIIQQSEFKSEIRHLESKGGLPPNNSLLSLNPFLDKDNILRVGGRLKHSALADDQKHPILLPKNHQFTELVINYYHILSLHAGTQVVLSLIRQRFWFTAARDKVRRALKRCLVCFRTKSQTLTQIMGDLPKDRVIASRPFLKTGLDFAGPFITKPNLKRSRVTLKSYIAIFICFSTKAVHLEVVSDLSSEAFLASLRRFTSRRGKPSDIYSDNATNFKGASNYLHSQYQICKSEHIQNFIAQQSITWHFIPPSAPHFGGLWEANVKSMKQHLLKTCKSAILNFEELSTLTTQIEACLNSRPLTALSSDPNDVQPLTPGHFLIGSSLLALPESNTSQEGLSFTSRWKIIQGLRAHFWKRWSNEYLTQHQTRSKWRTQKSDIQLGTLVLVKEDNAPPMHWSIARVTKVFPGEDGHARVVELKTQKGTLKRPIVKLCPLPLEG